METTVRFYFADDSSDTLTFEGVRLARIFVKGLLASGHISIEVSIDWGSYVEVHTHDHDGWSSYELAR